MAKFYLQIGEKSYEMEYTRDSARQFESAGYSIPAMGEKIFTSIDGLMFVGLIQHNPKMNLNLARKITDSALAEYDTGELYAALSEKFAEVFMNAEKSAKKKTLKLLPTPPTKVAKAEEIDE